MKNQYFGDVNDYRKYGLLRLLGGNGSLRVGVCWMLTPNDTRPDGEKTEYLDDDRREEWRHFDSNLYDFLRLKVHGHESEPKSRDVRNLTTTQLPHAEFYSEVVSDAKDKREAYFREMWSQFAKSQADLIFFDPDDGLANNNTSQSPLKKGHKDSAKKLFRDEVGESLKRGFVVLLYQHFDRTSRSQLVTRLGCELAGMTTARQCFSFWTPHVVFFLVPPGKHLDKIANAVDRVRASEWTTANSCPTSRKNDKRHILVGVHQVESEAEA